MRERRGILSRVATVAFDPYRQLRTRLDDRDMTTRSVDYAASRPRFSPAALIGQPRKRVAARLLQRRSGLACVELATTAPIMVLITLAIIDACNALHLKQKLDTVAFETARIASLSDSTYLSAKAEGLQFAEARGLVGASIVVESRDVQKHPTREQLPLGFFLRCSVAVPIEGNIPGPFVMLRGATMASQTVELTAR